jgi:sugar-phosphatase
VLEDAPAGVAAGRAAGARVLAVRTTHADADLRGADAIVDDLGAVF